MSEPIVTTRRQPAAWGRWVALAIVLLLPVAVVGGLMAFLNAGGPQVPSVADMEGGPVRVAVAGTDRVYLMTSQYETYKAGRRGPTLGPLIVDVWAFEARDGRPVWRRRLVSDSGAAHVDRGILGAQGGVLWIADGKGLRGLKLSDGATAYDTAAIEAANPGLSGVMPTEERFYRFDRGGVTFTAADGKGWRLSGDGAKAVPAGPEPATTAAGVTPALPPSIPTSSFHDRGVAIGQRWLGLLHESEAPDVGDGREVGGAPPESDPRMRVWSARVVRERTFTGARKRYADLRPLPESPVFLQPSLLANTGLSDNEPVFTRNPDSVLVLHSDRLGDDGRLRLSRVAAPAGKVLWTADLPAWGLEAVLPGERSVVLIGTRPETPVWRRPGDTTSMDYVDQLIAIDLSTGRMGVYGFRVKPGKDGHIPESSTLTP